MTLHLEVAEVATPLGPLVLAAGPSGLEAAVFAESWPAERARRFAGRTLRRVADPIGARSRLEAYFAGELDALDAVSVDPHGTPFQLTVWRALRTIRAGATRSYGEIARAVGQPRAVRAVGAANGQNPVALFIPCHRVIGADGSLTGYGGGLDRKRWLLQHERVLAPSLALDSP
jgi:methylated-DNA-[protein]-cysteine S-methyltransferase